MLYTVLFTLTLCFLVVLPVTTWVAKRVHREPKESVAQAIMLLWFFGCMTWTVACFYVVTTFVMPEFNAVHERMVERNPYK